MYASLKNVNIDTASLDIILIASKYNKKSRVPFSTRQRLVNASADRLQVCYTGDKEQKQLSKPPQGVWGKS